MKNLLVLAEPGLSHLAALGQLPVDHALWDRAAVERALQQGTALPFDSVLVCMGQAERLKTLWPLLPSVTWVHTLSAGVDTLLFDALVRSNVEVTNAAGVYAQPLAEFALWAILHHTRGGARLAQAQRDARWDPFAPAELAGQQLLVVGYGGIGRAVAVRARAFGMRITAVRRHPAPDEVVQDVWGMDALDVLLPTADHVVLCAPLTVDTHRLMDARRLSRMKRTGFLINVGRGGLVDESALAGALANDKLGGAALDVFETEPLPPNHPLWHLPNVVLSPHCADQVAGWQTRSMALFMENARATLAGKPRKNVVQKALGY